MYCFCFCIYNTYLTFVGSVVSFLYKLDLQVPIVRMFGMQDLEALIIGEGHYAWWQDVPVSSPYPGHFLFTDKTLFSYSLCSTLQLLIQLEPVHFLLRHFSLNSICFLWDLFIVVIRINYSYNLNCFSNLVCVALKQISKQCVVPNFKW